MSKISLCDNDVILKACCFDLPTATLVSLYDIGEVHILGAAKFVVSSRISKGKGSYDRKIAADNLIMFLENSIELEPTNEELELASAFEEAAQKENLALDTGESILLSILCLRSANALVTGDKRAVASIEQIKCVQAMTSKIDGRIVCLEQMFFHFCSICSVHCLRDRVCKRSDVDKAIAICFSCRSGSISEQEVIDGLTSYIDDLRKIAPDVLIRSYDLSGVIS